MVQTKRSTGMVMTGAVVPYRPSRMMTILIQDVVNPDITKPCWAERLSNPLSLLGQVLGISRHLSVPELIVSFGVSCFFSGLIWQISAPLALRLMADSIGLFSFFFVFVLSWYLRTGNPVLVGLYVGCWVVISYKTWWDYYRWIIAMQLLTGLASSYEGNYLAASIFAVFSPVFLSVLFFFALSAFTLFLALLWRTKDVG